MRTSRLRCALALLPCILAFTAVLPAQRGGGGRGLGAPAANPFPSKNVPFEPGFRAYIVANMAGIGAAVDMKEVMAGSETGAPVQTNTASFADYE